MAIELTYRNLLLQAYILEQLKTGQPLSAIALQDFVTELSTRDLSVPQFVAQDNHVDRFSSATASQFNGTTKAILQDLRVLYLELLSLIEVSTNTLERWNLESSILEQKLIRLEDEIDDLLLVAQDTEGYFDVIVDDFVNMNFVDQTQTTAEVDLSAGEVRMKSNNNVLAATRIFLNTLLDQDVTFNVRNTDGFVNQSFNVNNKLIYPFLQDSRNWWTIVHMSKKVPITCELTVKLSDDLIEVSRIFIELHDSVQATPITVTPMYSVDNVTYFQLPTTSFTQEVRSRASFSFTPVEAKWIKLILTKTGPDPSLNAGTFDYQFGFKNIQFFHEGFDSDTDQVLVSKPLSVVDKDGVVQSFSKLILETCERLETDTNIKYEVAISNDSSLPVNSSTIWSPITPKQRATRDDPLILEVGDISEITIGNDENLQVSYDPFAVGEINPDEEFHLLSQTDGTILDSTITATSTRYKFVNDNDRILNYQIKDSTYTGSGDEAIDVNPTSMILFRNVGEKGLTPGDVDEQVRGIQRGWAFNDPWYSCVVEVQNPDGLDLGDVGPKPIYIDDKPYTGHQVTGSILTGKTSDFNGIHRISVHKDNWREVTPGANTLSALQDLDPLYPYNHKLLIEGYDYGISYIEEEIYAGVDLFAAIKMKQVGLFDFLYNMQPNDYTLFALDRDAPSTHTGDNEATRVFLVKVDNENPDFNNEKYVLKFKLLNDLRKYLRLRATFSTTNSQVAPALEAYKIKLG